MITGEAGGIGRAIATELLRLGARPIVVDLPGRYAPPGAEKISANLSGITGVRSARTVGCCVGMTLVEPTPGAAALTAQRQHPQKAPMTWLDSLPWSLLFLACLTLGLAPFAPRSSHANGSREYRAGKGSTSLDQ